MDAVKNQDFCERLRLILSLVPSLSANGAMQCAQLAQTIAPNTDFYELLMQSQQFRREIMTATTCSPSKAPEVHPEAMVQLSLALRAPLDKAGHGRS